METPIVGATLTATLAAAVAVIGWLVNHSLTRARDRYNQELEASLKYTERQLEELYGPLAFLVLEGRRTWNDLTTRLGRPHVFILSKELPQDELDLRLFMVDYDFIPRNQRIANLLQAKTHLIEGSTLADSYKSFLDHHNAWKVDHLRWPRERIPYSWHSKTNWPDEFENEVLATFAALKARHTRFLARAMPPVSMPL